MEEDELSDADYLVGLAERIFNIPATYDVDQGDYDRLHEIAQKLGDK